MVLCFDGSSSGNMAKREGREEDKTNRADVPKRSFSWCNELTHRDHGYQS